MKFEYLIKRKTDNKLYNGKAYGDNRDWTNEKREGFDGAFAYTQNGAFAKISKFPIMFQDCEIVRK